MGLGALFRRGEAQTESRDSAMWSLPGGYGYTSAAYGPPADALKNAASWACINVLADAIGRTPIDVFRGDGANKQPVTPTPTVVANPSGLVGPDVWRFQLGWSMATDGNAFGKIVKSTRVGWPEMIELLDPRSVTERQVVKGKAQVRLDGSEVHDLYPFGDIWHIPGRTPTPGSPFGLSPIDQAANVIGTSLAAEDYSRRFFTDTGHPTGILRTDVNPGPDGARDAKEAWRRATEGSREPVIGNFTFDRILVDPSETQFIDLIRVMVDQVCRFWGVPPSMVYGSVSGQAVTYANITDYDLSFLKHSLDGYYVRVEEGLTGILPRPQVARMNRNAILRADATARYEAYSVALANRQVTVNEIRDLEDLPPFGPDFDVPGIPPFPGAPPITAPPAMNPPKEGSTG